ncbi:MAG: DUF2117 domain-containing protein [Candidatus Helarchaeota archaeon]|nr:DUF2117 domain-containing protein [Candidatus Helarchaeota archaeon]
MYEISGKKDIHGLRMRLIYTLRKQNAIQLMRSTWLISAIEPNLQAIIDECIYQGYPILITEWSPLYLQEHIRDKDASLAELHIGVVIHSPEVTELGITKEFISRLDKGGLQYHAILGGVMGRLAILDTKLEEKVFINHPYKPSEAIDYLIKRNMDLIILLNQGITQESGIEFGRQVVENSKLLSFFQVPIIQLDRLQNVDAFMICWNHDHLLFQNWLKENYHLDTIKPSPKQELFKVEGDSLTRILRAVQKNDKILVNGVVIGEVTSNIVEIIAKSNIIIDIKGGRKNPHGVEKLGPIDLKNARITTLKSLRRVHTSSQRKISAPKKRTNTAMLTWRGEKVYYHADKIDCLVSIGDDTTFISTEILSRFSRPIIGIIDGDADGILYEETSLSQLIEIAPDKSLFILVKPEYDDVVGRLIEKQIFKNRVKIKYSRLSELKERILALSEDYLIETSSR